MYVLYGIMMITQIIFSLFEIAEIKQNGLANYFKEGWNYFQFSLLVFFIILLLIKLYKIKFEIYDFKKLCV